MRSFTARLHRSFGGLRNYFTRSAYRNVFNVCSQLLLDGETVPIMTVLQFPINESRKTYVNLDPRNGTWRLFWSRNRIHSFSASNDLLISAPSLRVCRAQSAVSAPRSLPARSINVNLLYSVHWSFYNVWLEMWTVWPFLLLWCKLTLLLPLIQ